MFLVADEPRRTPFDARRHGKLPIETSLLPKLATRGFERRLARLDLAADRQPLSEAPVSD
jgi:hypothetical protein